MSVHGLFNRPLNSVAHVDYLDLPGIITTQIQETDEQISVKAEEAEQMNKCPNCGKEETLCVFRSKWASDSTGSGTRFRLKRDMIPLGSGPHFGLERNAVPHGTESRPAWNGTGDGGVESEQAALVIPGRCFPEVKGEYFARTEITHEKNTRNPTPPF